MEEERNPEGNAARLAKWEALVEASYDVRIGALLRRDAPLFTSLPDRGGRVCGTPRSLDFGYVWLCF